MKLFNFAKYEEHKGFKLNGKFNVYYSSRWINFVYRGKIVDKGSYISISYEPTRIIRKKSSFYYAYIFRWCPGWRKFNYTKAMMFIE